MNSLHSIAFTVDLLCKALTGIADADLNRDAAPVHRRRTVHASSGEWLDRISPERAYLFSEQHAVFTQPPRGTRARR